MEALGLLSATGEPDQLTARSTPRCSDSHSLMPPRIPAELSTTVTSPPR